MAGDWGWRGLFRRALELPAGLASAVSPQGRARVRYNEQDDTLEASLNAAPYAALLTTAASSELDTIHFNVGDITKKVEAPVVGVPDPDAMSCFGQLNISRPRRVEHFHIHLIKNGTSGQLTIEWYKLDSAFGPLVLTKIGDATLDFSAGDYATAVYTPPGGYLFAAGNYILVQSTDLSSIVTGKGDGLTLDVHFMPV